MIHPSKSVGDQQARNKDALIREISIMEKLDHRNICKLFEVFVQKDNGISEWASFILSHEDPDQFFLSFIDLVLELVEGGDLLEYIVKSDGLCTCHIISRRGDTFDFVFIAEVDARDITYQMCTALAVRIAPVIF